MTILEGEPAELAGRRWLFGTAVLDERSLELEVRGEQVRLERKPLEVLLYLLHHAGEVVTKDDLAEGLWAGRILTETVLARCISLLRQALKDDDRTLIRTVHGYGYRLVADVRIEASAAPTPPALDFKPGDHPPLRPQWKLVERLGTGGHGEAWLARHEKTGDARVFKFALDARALTSLKREITLYRLLHDSLGARAAIARILEWNLAEPPYFIEMEHVSGGNLLAWSEAQGGLAGVPLEARLDLAAQIAEALAAAHSVGALHKDLKPANVLVQVESGKPTVRLCDFGSGGVLDPQRLEALGITRLGFTKTLADGDAAGTPLYLAPEVVAGQPFTVQADVYALGVLLYQLITGDLRKALAPGWEADVGDELLREDIAAAAAGNPAKRLTDAAQLAERLRTLNSRREARAVEAAARQRAELARRTLAELKRTRVYAGLLLALAAVAIAGGVMAYRARNEAVAATATAKAIGDFLMEDVFRVDAGLFRPAETSYEVLLQRAAKEVGVRLRHQPEAAASIHWMLGRRYQDTGNFDVASEHYQQAVDLFTRVEGRSGERTLIALDRLAWLELESGRWADAIALSQQVEALWRSELPHSDLAVLMVRIRTARILMVAGHYAQAEEILRDVLRTTATADASAQRVIPLLKQWLGVDVRPEQALDIVTGYTHLLLGASVLEEFSEGYEESEALLRTALSIFSKSLGEDAELSALSSLSLAVVLGQTGKTDEAEQYAKRGGELWASHLPARHYAQGLPTWALGRVRTGQQRFADAIELFRTSLDLCTPAGGCPPRVRAEFSLDLATAISEIGEGATAISLLRTCLDIQERILPPNHVVLLRTKVGLAEALRQSSRLDEASAVLASISGEAISALKPNQEVVAHLHRAHGLVSLDAGQFERAARELEEARRILKYRYGNSHWRVERAHAEAGAARACASRNGGCSRR